MAIASGMWSSVSEIGPSQPIDAVSATQQHPVGHVVRCRDTGATAYGEAEFVYLRGVLNTVVGDLVVYEGNGVTARTVARSTGPAAAAMAAVGDNQWGWYQVRGRAKVRAGAVADNATLYLTATPGTVDDQIATGDIIFGARSDSATDTGFILATLSYPYCGDTDNA